MLTQHLDEVRVHASPAHDEHMRCFAQSPLQRDTVILRTLECVLGLNGNSNSRQQHLVVVAHDRSFVTINHSILFAHFDRRRIANQIRADFIV